MPRPGPRRPVLAVKIGAAVIATIDRNALALGVTRSDWARAALELAVTDPAAVTRSLQQHQTSPATTEGPAMPTRNAAPSGPFVT